MVLRLFEKSTGEHLFIEVVESFLETASKPLLTTFAKKLLYAMLTN